MKLPRLHIPGESPKPDEETQKAAVTEPPAVEPGKDHSVVSDAEVDQTKSSESTIAQIVTTSRVALPGLYVYCIVPSTAPKDYGKIGVEGNGSVYAVEYKDIAAVVSEFPGTSSKRLTRICSPINVWCRRFSRNRWASQSNSEQLLHAGKMS